MTGTPDLGGAFLALFVLFVGKSLIMAVILNIILKNNVLSWKRWVYSLGYFIYASVLTIVSFFARTSAPYLFISPNLFGTTTSKLLFALVYSLVGLISIPLFILLIYLPIRKHLELAQIKKVLLWFSVGLLVTEIIIPLIPLILD